ncbi:MAG: hypothetical protein ACKO9B_05150 [Planctomycetota bacterium]
MTRLITTAFTEEGLCYRLLGALAGGDSDFAELAEGDREVPGDGVAEEAEV